MNARNKYEENIDRLASKLPGLTKAQIEWASKHCFPNVGIQTGKNKGWCTQCGGELIIGKGGKLVCPHCGSRLELKEGKLRVYKGRSYFTVLTTIGGFQVCRNFFFEKVSRRRGGTEISFFECVQNWIDTKGKETVRALRTSPFPLYYDIWDRESEMSFKIKTLTTNRKYDIDGYVYPRAKILPLFKRNGFKVRYAESYPPMNCLFSMLATDREAEMLIKQNQFHLLYYKYRHDIPEFGMPDQSIKIASRHGYIIKDASLWLDHISLLDFFGLDTRNPHYICPADIHIEHDRLSQRKAIADAKAKLAKDIEDSKEWEAKYAEMKAPYLGICFGNENITISVIKSVADMAEEGAAMHHCVFSMEYYKKEDSLILTARDKAGNRIETIEISLSKLEVIQSRGLLNKNTPNHEEIVNLVRSNMQLFKNAT